MHHTKEFDDLSNETGIPKNKLLKKVHNSSSMKLDKVTIDDDVIKFVEKEKIN